MREIMELCSKIEPFTPPEQPKPAVEASTGRWKPKCGKGYGWIDSAGDWITGAWDGVGRYDKLRYATGNCYPLDQKKLAIWEQVTRREYDQQLRDAADWVSGNTWYYGFWSKKLKGIGASATYDASCNLPRFKSNESCIEAHNRILGDDAERYLNNR